MQTVYEFSAPLSAQSAGGQAKSLADFRGQVLLIVNTASLCGFTPQYAGLETLYRTYKDRGFAVLGFPCNQFGGQEPGSDGEISALCSKNYGVTFPVFARIEVNGLNAHPLYRFLKKEKPGILGFLSSGAIRWNFTKFLIDEEGKVVARYGPGRTPRTLSSAIERLLGVS